MAELGVLKFQVAFGAVRHFGRNLYSTTPPAVAELVANSWDAYARDLLAQNGIRLRCYDKLVRTSRRIYEVNFSEDLSQI